LGEHRQRLPRIHLCRTLQGGVGMSAHIVSDTACLPVLTSSSCLHSQTRPAAQTQRLPQRTPGVFSAKHACQVPRRRTGRNSTKVLTDLSTACVLDQCREVLKPSEQIETARNLQVFARAAQEQRTQVQLPEGYVRYSASGLYRMKHMNLVSIIKPMTLVTIIHKL